MHSFSLADSPKTIGRKKNTHRLTFLCFDFFIQLDVKVSGAFWTEEEQQRLDDGWHSRQTKQDMPPLMIAQDKVEANNLKRQGGSMATAQHFGSAFCNHLLKRYVGYLIVILTTLIQVRPKQKPLLVCLP